MRKFPEMMRLVLLSARNQSMPDSTHVESLTSRPESVDVRHADLKDKVHELFTCIHCDAEVLAKFRLRVGFRRGSGQ